MKGHLDSARKGLDGMATVTLSTPNNEVNALIPLVGQDINFEAKKRRDPRSKDANALMWAVCEELAEALKSTKVEIYRRAIRDVGVYHPLPIPDYAVDSFCQNWESGGTGWVADKTDRSKTPGYTLVFAYFGSSTYDSKEFSRLVDHLITDAEESGIVLKAGPELEARAKEIGKC